jgi:hypothetical protein
MVQSLSMATAAASWRTTTTIERASAITVATQDMGGAVGMSNHLEQAVVAVLELYRQ